MPNGALCQRCVGGQRPEVYVVSLAGTCCKCGVSEYESSVCGTCQPKTATPCPCDGCTEFNGYFELPAAKGDCSRYVKEFPSGKGPCGATSVELRLTPHTDPQRVNACVHIHFDQSAGLVRPVSWRKTGVGNCCEIGCLRRRSTNRKCCWPHEITVTPVPVPDFTSPQPHWLPGDPDDLNDAPFWPTLDLDLREDSPEAPVRYYNGELQLRIKDLGADGLGVPWGHTRIYSNRLSNSYDFGNGYNWLIHEQPRLVRFKTPHAKIKKLHEQEQPPPKGEPTGCTIVVLRGTRNALWFDEYAQGKSRHWYPRFGARHCLCYEGGKRCHFHLTAPNGHRWEFYDFTCLHSKALQLAGLTLAERLVRVPGALVRHQGPGGQEARLTYKDCRLQKVERFAAPHAPQGSSAGPSGLVEMYTYTYFPPEPHENRVRYVTLSRQGKPIARVEYLYYEPGEGFGEQGDLKLAVRQLPRDEKVEQWNNIDVHYYRYEHEARDTYCQGMLQMVVGPEHVRRAVKKTVGTNELEAIAKASVPELGKWGDTLITHSPTCPLADLYIEYDKKRRVTTLYMNGGGRVHNFEYTDGFDEINYNAWRRRCIELRSDGRSRRAVYSSFVGRNILTCLFGDGKDWTQYRIYDIHDGALRMETAPSGVLTFAETSTVPSPATAQNYISQAMATRQPGSAAEISGLRVRFRERDGLFQFPDYDGSGMLSDVRVSNNGSSASALQVHHLAHYEYGGRNIPCSPSPTCWLTAQSLSLAVERAADSKAAATKFDYAWLGDPWTQMTKRTATLPTIRVDENGSGMPDQVIERFEAHGYRKELIDERWVVTRWSYDIVKDAVKQIVEDFAGDLLRTTDVTADDLGRTTQVLGPEHAMVTQGSPNRAVPRRPATWYAYNDVKGEVYTARGSMPASGGGGEEVVGPISLTRLDRAARLTDEIGALSGKKPASNSTYAQSSWVGWQSQRYDDQDKQRWSRVYHRIPVAGEGMPVADYAETRFAYDRLYRRQYVITPGGTVTKTIHEARGLPVVIALGAIAAGPTGSDPEQVLAVLRQVTSLQYDDDMGGGNGNLTQRIDCVDSDDPAKGRKTRWEYDWRNNPHDMHRPDETTNVSFEHDWLGRQTRRNDAPRGHDSFSYFDQRGRVYRVDEIFQRLVPAPNGTVVTTYGKLSTNHWYDPTGNLIARDLNNGQSFDKLLYDSLGREVLHFVGCNDVSGDGTVFRRIGSLQEASEVIRDVIFEQTETAYDAGDNVISLTTRRRSPGANAAGSGIRKGELVAENLPPQARVSHAAVWHDALGRPVAEADYGATGWASFVRPAVIPGSTDALPVRRTWYGFDLSNNEFVEQSDPYGRIFRTKYDRAGRPAEESENYSRSAIFTYTPDGLIRTIAASNLVTGNQVTEHVYGGLLDGVGLSILLARVKDPEGRVKSFAYDRQREVVTFTDANGTVHRYGYDQLARLRHDSVVGGVKVDLRVREIGYDYDAEGSLRAITSYDAPRPAPTLVGKTVNRIDRWYNQFKLLTVEDQMHSLAEANASDRMRIEYGYSVGGVAGLAYPVHAPRRTTIAYPHGRMLDTRPRFLLHLQYSDRLCSAALNRLAIIREGQMKPAVSDQLLSAVETIGKQALAVYTYFGPTDFYRVLYPETRVLQAVGKELTVGVSGGVHPAADYVNELAYSGLDGFDRVRQANWAQRDYGFPERLEYWYDRVGSRLARQNRPFLAWPVPAVPTPLTTRHDERYEYDSLDRLQAMDRGTLTGGVTQSGVINPTFHQKWTHDPQDNWRVFLEDAAGDGTFELAQVRTHDRSNRITTLQVPPLSGTSRYDGVGNMTYVPDPYYPKLGYYCEFDGWNRLVRVTRAGKRVAEFEYDGLGRRVLKRTFDQYGNLLESRHFYYSDDWRLLEERVEQPGKKPWQGRVERRYVWGARGLDDLILRDRDAEQPLDGNTDERLYVLGDANGNVVSLYHVPHPSGAGGSAQRIVERAEFAPYGQPHFMSPNFASRAQSAYDWNILFGGYYFDKETGLYLVRNRMYHPLYGRWLQTDPLGFADSYNLYQYCYSSPLSYLDPTGELVPFVFLAFFAAVAAGATLIEPTSERGITEGQAGRIRERHQEQQVQEFANWASLGLPMGAARTLLGRMALGAATNVGIHAGEDALTLAATGDLGRYRDPSGQFNYGQLASEYAWDATIGALFPAGATILRRGSRWIRGVGTKEARINRRALFGDIPVRGKVKRLDPTISDNIPWILNPNRLGYTDIWGNVFMRPGLKGGYRQFAAWHESVHRFVSLHFLGPLARPWQVANIVSYKLFGTHRYLEEAVAQGYAAYRYTRNIRMAVREAARFPMRAGYIQGWKSFAGEIVVGTAVGLCSAHSLLGDSQP